MPKDPSLKALFKLNECDDRVANIKRLALLFDELHYLPPETHPTLIGEPLDDGLIRLRGPAGELVTEEFNFFLHTGPGLCYEDESIHDAELRDTLAELREARIAHRVESQPTVLEDSSFQLARAALATSELQDETFRKLSRTTEEQPLKLKVTTLQLVDRETGTERTDYLIRSPNAIVDSYDLTDVLTTAHGLHACPVFLDVHHRKELQYRYQRSTQGLATAAATFPELGDGRSMKNRYGEVAFSVASEIFTDAVISQRSISEIIRYRSRMDDARRQYVSTDLMELTMLAEDSPWAPKTEREIERYIYSKLTKDLTVYRNTMRETWEKMFGSLATIGIKAAQGGGAGGILGELIPHASLWELALLGAIGGVLKEAPAVAKTLVDSILAARAQRRNAIAYVAEFK